MSKIVIFGGTSEGRRIAELCSENALPVTVCVATEYGEAMLPELRGGTIRTGRMDEEEMKTFLEQEKPELVIDATHPYAEAVSENLESACGETETAYCRLKRESAKESGFSAGTDVIFVDSAEEAAKKAEALTGSVFLATGSKELPVFCEKMTDMSRIYARILPSPQALQSSLALGLSAKRIICMHGPFTEEMNRSMFRQTGAQILVTKESGRAGGFSEKMRAARALAMTCIVIRRPKEKEGFSFEEVCEKLGISSRDTGKPYGGAITRRGAKPVPESGKEEKNSALAAWSDGQTEIAVVGIGMGYLQGMTQEALTALSDSEVIFGASRMLKSIGFAEKEKVCSYQSEEIRKYLAGHPFIRKAAVVFSGDVGFYSGSRKICGDLKEYPLKLICGISSVSYFAAKLKMPWQNIKLCSHHGRSCHLAAHIRREKKVFSLFGKSAEVRELAGQLYDFGMNNIKLFIGVDLGCQDEKIAEGFPEDFLDFEAEGLCVGIFENPAPEEIVTPGLPDPCFLRGKVPMTKEEIRALILCKLNLTKNAVVYDIGAGTGSVSVECARLLPDGIVYAVEKNEEALALLSENRKRFGAEQMNIIAGEAPAVLEKLPAPTHVFIGGSGGKLREILTLLLRKNSAVRIVAAAVTMETQAELTRLSKELLLRDAEAVTIAVSRANAAGSCHLWQAMNPVTVFSFGGGEVA